MAETDALPHGRASASRTMAKIKDKVENALNEARMLVLGAQVLVGFQFRSFFEPGFDKLPLPSQLLKMVGLGLMLLAVALIISPAAYHRLVERGEDTREIHRYTSKLMTWALLPFCFGLGLDFYVAAEKVFGWKAGAAAGLFGTLLAASCWYALEFYMRRERREEIEAEKGKSEMSEAKEEGPDERQKLTDKIKHVLT